MLVAMAKLDAERIARLRRGAMGCLAVTMAFALLSPGPVSALEYRSRPDWVFGVGWGVGRGAITDNEFGEAEYRDGASPHIRLGRMLGQSAMVGIHWESWLIEFGNEPIKFRRTLQNLALGITWFPGQADGPSGGIFVRGGVGMGWAGTGAKEAIEGGKQHKGERLDEWGTGFFGEAGYEFWITRNFTAGLAATYNYFAIDEAFVDSAWFTAGVLHLNLYF